VNVKPVEKPEDGGTAGTPRVHHRLCLLGLGGNARVLPTLDQDMNTNRTALNHGGQHAATRLRYPRG
jgi:hypothetical protein